MRARLNLISMGWIEFETKIGEKVLLRPEHIQSILQFGNHTMLYYEYIPFGSAQKEATSIVELAEPYEQVKQKIMDVEKVDYSNVVAEHFTREEYELIENVMLHKVDQLAKDEPCTSNYYDHDRILIKLNNILKEKE